MNLSLLVVKLLMTPICCRTKSKLLNTGFKALYYLAPTYFPSLTVPILPPASRPVQESCVPVSWTNCYSHSLGPAAITYSTGNVVSTFSLFDLPSVSEARQFPHKAFPSFPSRSYSLASLKSYST